MTKKMLCLLRRELCSMPSIDTIVTVASWEPRFLLGLERLLNETEASSVLMYFFKEYRTRSQPARDAVAHFTRSRDVNLIEEELEFEVPANSWRTLQSNLYREPKIAGEILVDITTMPRETIWATLFWLEAGEKNVHYAYHRPSAYPSLWLSRDPNEPRLAFKLAGMPLLDRLTALVAVTGYDTDRVVQAIEFFEPAQTILVAQVGTQFANPERNIEAHDVIALRNCSIKRCEVDSYAEDHGYKKLHEITAELAQQYNVVMFSFGPKPTAVALYRVQRMIPESTLAYIHCKDYNERYSEGIGDTIRGSLHLAPFGADRQIGSGCVDC